MPDPVLWPPSLPQHVFLGATDEVVPSTAVFRPDIGVPKARLRSTTARRLFTTPIELTGEEREAFTEFWEAIGYGIDPFQWVDPTTGTATLFVFQRDDNRVRAPRWTMIGGGALGGVGSKTTYDLRRYTAVLELERVSDAA